MREWRRRAVGDDRSEERNVTGMEWVASEARAGGGWARSGGQGE
jgi:hypothetical protein